MFRRVAVIAATLSAVAILGSTVVGSALAQGPTPAQVPSPVAPTGLGLRLGGRAGGPAWGGQATLDVVSKLTGLKVEEIQDLRQDGKSLAQIAQAKGIATDKLVTAILAAKKAVVDGLVKDGKLTQVQADAMIANMATQVETAVMRTTVAPVNGRGGGACLGAGPSASLGTVAPGQGFRGGRGTTSGFNGRGQGPAAPSTGN